MGAHGQRRLPATKVSPLDKGFPSRQRVPLGEIHLSSELEPAVLGPENLETEIGSPFPVDGLAHHHPKLSFSSVQPVQDRFSTHDRVRFARLYNHEESGAVWPRKHSVDPEVEEQG